jgi:hypothetical protein
MPISPATFANDIAVLAKDSDPAIASQLQSRNGE